MVKIASFFSGVGGMDLGFSWAGFDVVFANDFDERVKETYNTNHDVDICIDDIRELSADNIPDVDGVIGGPPCQSWSVAGKGEGVNDSRGGLAFEYLNLIDELDAKFFVLENVKGMLYKNRRDAFDSLVENFEEIGFTVYWDVLDASYYGVPQSRERLFVVGFKEDIDFTFPKPCEKRTVQSDSVLGELPAAKAGSSVERENCYLDEGFSPRFKSRNRYRGWDEPAYTVLASGRHVRLHPDSDPMVKVDTGEWVFGETYRRYTVKEASVVQSFPIDFEFRFENLKDGYRMVGNAVPPELAKRVGGEVLKSIE